MKARLDAAVERARKALRGDDLSEIRAAQEELSKVYNEAGQSFYAQSQAASGTGGEPGQGGAQPGEATAGAKPADDVVEADYEIVDDAKK
jgi:molecular chaperone DnaK